jgi:formylglycine-generating enzyme required for sulfatase activity
MAKLRTLIGLILAGFTASEVVDGEAGCGCNMRRSEDQAVLTVDPASCNAIKSSLPSGSAMTLIEGGIGFIGTDSPIMRRDGEGPRRAANLSSFYIDTYEVSNKGIADSQ